MLSPSNSVASEDDDELARGMLTMQCDRLFWLCLFQERAESCVAIDGGWCSAERGNGGNGRVRFGETVVHLYDGRAHGGKEAGGRPLSTYYLTDVNEEIGDVGYFPLATRRCVECKTAGLARWGSREW